MKFFTLSLLLITSASVLAGYMLPKYPDFHLDHTPKKKAYSFKKKKFYDFMRPFGKNYGKALFKAASLGYNSIIERILNSSISVDVCDHDGKTALAYAAQAGQAETCAFLIEHGAHVDSPTNWDSTPLMWAAQNGHLETCKVLLKAGAKVNAATNEGKTALMYAAERGHTNVCRLLLHYGAYVDARTGWSSTALMWAAENGHLATFKLLAQYGADVNACSNKGKTVSDYAYGHYGICTFLRDYIQPCDCCPCCLEGQYNLEEQQKKNNKEVDMGTFTTAAILGTLFSYWLLT